MTKSAAEKKHDKLLYDIEFSGGFGGFFIDVADAQEWVNDILTSKWWKARNKVTRVDLTYGKVRRFCAAYFHDGKVDETWAHIDLTRGRLCEAYILHELAHVLSWSGPKEWEHGPRFLSSLLDINKHFMPTYVYKRLLNELKYNGMLGDK